MQLHHVSDGVYDRGGRRDNVREAKAVADLVLEHFREHGDRKTLGVIAFSQAQMFAIEDEIDRRLALEPDLEPLSKPDRLGGFFVKNLETVQGDERDVILLSVGYGRDQAGKFTMHFGPLNREGGHAASTWPSPAPAKNWSSSARSALQTWMPVERRQKGYNICVAISISRSAAWMPWKK